MGNQDHLSYARVVQLGEGHRVFLRFLNQGDREGFAELVREAVPEDTWFLKQNFRDQKTLNNWFEQLNYHQVLPLVAVDLDPHRFAAVAILQRGEQAFQHIGNILLLVSEPYRCLGLGSLMLEDLIQLAKEKELYWLAAEVFWEQPHVIDAFESKGFEIKARLPDYFRCPNGVTRDVVLLMRPVLRTKSIF